MCQMFSVITYIFQTINVEDYLLFIYYRPRSEGDYVLGSVRPSVRLSVRLFVSLSDLSCLNRLTFDLDILRRGRP